MNTVPKQENLLSGEEILNRLATKKPQDYTNLVRVKRHHSKPLISISYSHECNASPMTSPFWDDFTVMCRGITIDTETAEIVAKPFNKFFNYDPQIFGEYEINDNAYALEKLDGSLGIGYTYKGKFQFKTKNSFTSAMANWANLKWLPRHDWVPEDIFNPDYTYCFEIIYPEMRDIDGSMTLVNYGDVEECFLLSIIDNKTGKELGWNVMQKFADEYGIMTPHRTFFKDIGSIVSRCKSLPYQEEGFVLTLEDGIKIKLKGEEYCRLHKILYGIGRRTIWKMLRDYDFSLPEDLKSASIPQEIADEKMAIYNQILSDAKEVSDRWFKKAGDLVQYLHLDQKELAEKINSNTVKANRERVMVFNILKGQNKRTLFYALKEIEDKYKEFDSNWDSDPSSSE